MSVRILVGDCREILRSLPDESVHCVCTSPPYFGLRDYGVVGQIGLETSPDEFVGELVAIFRDVRRVLRSDGTCWLNLGDSYANDGKWGGETGGKQAYLDDSNRKRVGREKRITGLKPKDLVGIPWRVAFALQADGWWLRQDIIWSKPNPMPESVTDRCTKAHEYLFLLSKSERYYFNQDAIREPFADASLARLSQDTEAQAGSDRVPGKTNGNMKAVGNASWKGSTFDGPRDLAVRPDTGRKRSSYRPGSASNMNDGEHVAKSDAGLPVNPAGRNKRSVWEVTTQPFALAHFATFPPALIEPCILAGCPEFTCSQCGTALDQNIKDAIRSSTNGHALSSLQTAVSKSPIEGIEEPLLQQGLHGGRSSDRARDGSLSLVRDAGNAGPQGPTEKLLQQDLRVTLDGEEQTHHEGALHNLSGVHRGPPAGSSECVEGWLRDGASASGRAPVREAASADRGGASQERNSDGQRRREPGSNDEAGTRSSSEATKARAHRVPTLRGGDPSVPRCPHCRADLTAPDAIIPGTVLDCFGGAGTTGLVADRLKRNAILIELNPAYAEMAERRIRGDAPLLAVVSA